MSSSTPRPAAANTTSAERVPRFVSTVAVLTAVSFSLGCTKPIPYEPVRPGAKAAPLVFAVELQREVTSGDVGGVDKSKFASSTGREVLASARSVAFIPPDVCADLKSADAGTKSSVQVASTSCSVLMNSLEEAAAAAGYEVVSSQVLRSAKIGGTVGYLDNARQLNLDVIFEVSEWNFEDRAQRMKEVLGFRPLVADPSGELLPFEFLMTADWEDAFARCETMLDGRLSSVESSGATPLAAMLSLKAVDVATGRTVWFYTKRSDLNDNRAQANERWLFAAPPITGKTHTCQEYGEYAVEKYNQPFGVGWMRACMARQAPPNPADPSSFHDYGDNSIGNYIDDPTPNERMYIDARSMQQGATVANLLWMFVVPLLVGIPMGATANGQMKRWNEKTAEANEKNRMRGGKSTSTAASFLPAEQVICKSDYLVEPETGEPAETAAPEMVSGYRVKRNSADPKRDPVTQELIAATAAALRTELQSLR